MTLEECYEKLHGSYAEAKTRLMNDRLVDKFLRRFPTDPTMQELKAHVDSGNIQEQFRAAHTLKGVAANLALTQLQQDASALTEQLRSCTAPADPELLKKVEDSYQIAIDAIAELDS